MAPSDPTGLHPTERTWVPGGDEPTVEVPAERYTVLAELGRGSIGIVERVHDAHLDRPVARKRLLRDGPGDRARFINEARITASLAHPGIVPVYDLGLDAATGPYYTMQEIVGEPWYEALKRATSLDDRLAQLDVLLGAARAIAHAHEQGVVHRDVKPDNIMVSPLGDTWVVDWGLGVSADASSGGLAGTPQYMAPEQARGEPVDARADVWALGVLLFRILTGRPPYIGEGENLLTAVQEGSLPDVEALAPEAPPELLDMVLKATDPQRDGRYPHAGAFASDLKAFTQGHWVAAHRYSVGELARRLWQRHRVTVVVASLATLTISGAVLSAAWVTSRERDRAVLAEANALQQLAVSLEGQARAGAADRYDAQAQRHAAQALVLQPDLPYAWGILVRNAPFEHPRRTHSVPLPCPGIVAGDGRVAWACSDTGTFVASLELDAEQLGPAVLIEGDPYRNPIPQELLLHNGLVVLGKPDGTTVYRADDAQTVVRSAWRSSRAAPTAPLGPDIATVDVHGRVVRMQSNGTITPTGIEPWAHTFRSHGDALYLLSSHAGIRRCSTDLIQCEVVFDEGAYNHFAASETAIAIEDPKGAIVIQTLDGNSMERIPTDAGAFTQLEIVGDRLVALRTDGNVDVWYLDGTPAALLPTAGNHPRSLSAHGDELLVIGDRVESWSLGGAERSYIDAHPGAVVGWRGALVGSGMGGTTILGVDPIVGPAPENVVKALDVAADDSLLVVEVVGPLTRWHPITNDVTRYLTTSTAPRRAVTDGRGGAWIMTYEKELVHMLPDGGYQETETMCWGDLARSADWTRLLCGRDNVLLDLDPHTGEVLSTLAEADQVLWAVATSTDGGIVAYALADRTVHLIDRATGATRTLGADHVGEVATMAFSPSGRWLVTGGWDQQLHVYEVASGRHLAVLDGHRGRVIDVAFYTDTRLGSAGWDRRLRHWDLSVLDVDPAEHLRRVQSETGMPE